MKKKGLQLLRKIDVFGHPIMLNFSSSNSKTGVHTEGSDYSTFTGGIVTFIV